MDGEIEIGAGDGCAAPGPVRPGLSRAAAYAWRLLVVAAALYGAAWLAGRLQYVLLSIVVAVLVARALSAPCRWLRAHGTPPALAAAACLAGFLLVVAGLLALIGASVANEADSLGPTISHAFDDIEDWLVDDSPFDVQRQDVDDFRSQAGDRVAHLIGTSGSSIVSGAVVAVEVVVSLILGLVLSFFCLKDGRTFVHFVGGFVPDEHRPMVRCMGERAWASLGGFLRGAALLGVAEGAIITVTLVLVGAKLAVPIGVLTLLAAFVPFVGAIVAGTLAVLVALATAGLAQAVVVLVVALLVQQFDNELLAPVIYGRALALHPVTVLLGIATGGALFGLAGSLVAVPATAVAVNVVSEYRNPTTGRRDAGAPEEGPDLGT